MQERDKNFESDLVLRIHFILIKTLNPTSSHNFFKAFNRYNLMY